GPGPAGSTGRSLPDVHLGLYPAAGATGPDRIPTARQRGGGTRPPRPGRRRRGALRAGPRLPPPAGARPTAPRPTPPHAPRRARWRHAAGAPGAPPQRVAQRRAPPPTARRCQAHIAPPNTAKPAEVSARLSRLELTSGATTPASTALSIRPKNVPSEAAAPRSCGNRSSTSSWIGANTRATVNAISIGPHTAISSDQCSPPVNGGARETSSRFSSVAAPAPTKPKVISRERGISSATRHTTQAPQSMPAISGT